MSLFVPINLSQKHHFSHHSETFKANVAHETFEATTMSHTCSRRIFTLSFCCVVYSLVSPKRHRDNTKIALIGQWEPLATILSTTYS